MFYYGEGVQEEVYPLEVPLRETAGEIGDFEWDTSLSTDNALAPSLFPSKQINFNKPKGRFADAWKVDQPYQQSFDLTIESDRWPLPASAVENPVPSPLEVTLSQLAVSTASMFPESNSDLPIESGMSAIQLAQGNFSGSTMPETVTTAAALTTSLESRANNPPFPCLEPNCPKTFPSKAALR